MNIKRENVTPPREMPAGLQQAVTSSGLGPMVSSLYLMWKKRGKPMDEATRRTLGFSITRALSPDIRFYWLDFEPFSVQFAYKDNLIKLRLSVIKDDQDEDNTVTLALEGDASNMIAESLDEMFVEQEVIPIPPGGHA